MDNKPTTAEIVIMAAGAVTLLFSFFNFVEFRGNGTSAWGSGLFPIATFPALFGLIMGGVVALTRFANVKLPHDILGFTWKQIHLALGAFALLLMLGYLIVDLDPTDRAFGFWLMFLGSIGLLVGAVMYRNEGDIAPTTGTTPPTPF